MVGAIAAAVASAAASAVAAGVVAVVVTAAVAAAAFAVAAAAVTVPPSAAVGTVPGARRYSGSLLPTGLPSVLVGGHLCRLPRGMGPGFGCAASGRLHPLPGNPEYPAHPGAISSAGGCPVPAWSVRSGLEMRCGPVVKIAGGGPDRLPGLLIRSGHPLAMARLAETWAGAPCGCCQAVMAPLPHRPIAFHLQTWKAW